MTQQEAVQRQLDRWTGITCGGARSANVDTTGCAAFATWCSADLMVAFCDHCAFVHHGDDDDFLQKITPAIATIYAHDDFERARWRAQLQIAEAERDVARAEADHFRRLWLIDKHGRRL